ncbi:NAD(P)/FAD-dependent oxidoreductase, partial [Labrys miyagiensis]|uniref:NAD(P)/FAD-dependent oxidoreductase n=1 Tax=Labrys miyagiensis TaxID=346912 RepID=UPI0024E1545B
APPRPKASTGVPQACASSEAFNMAAADIAVRASYGVGQNLLSADEVHRLEPRLPSFEGGGLFFPNAIGLSDPGAVMHLLFGAVRRMGVEFVRASAQEIVRQPKGVRIIAAPYEISARKAVIAAGARSRKLAAQIGDRIRLDTERGYHVEFDMAELPIERPIRPTARGFYLCPMNGRLRVAGLVEFGGLAAPATPSLVHNMVAYTRQILPNLGEPSRSWLGFRPSMPDSVPVIRPSQGARDVILAFGHGHIGLTLAPRTAQLVSALLTI